MFQGFYNLTSGMMTQHKNLSVVSNNLVNIKTPGYRADTYVARTFQEEMFYRMGNMDRKNQEAVGTISMARVGDETVTNHEAGYMDQTDGNLDFAIMGNGFFKVAMNQGGFAYTRNGSFSVDEEGALVLSGVGRVQGESGDVFLDTDAVSIDSTGALYDENGEELDHLVLVDFENYNQLMKGENSIFTTNQQENEAENVSVSQGYLEGSNVDMMKEASTMMQSQRSIQSAAQILKMYDTMMGKAVSEIGRV